MTQTFRFHTGALVINKGLDSPRARGLVVGQAIEGKHQHPFYVIEWLDDYKGPQRLLYPLTEIEHFYTLAPESERSESPSAPRSTEIRKLILKLNELNLANLTSLILINALRAALKGLTNPHEGDSEND